MSCPACGGALKGGQDRCPACGTIVSPPVEGSLAPDPLAGAPPREKVEPLREIPGLRKREKTWKDEVRERVRQRRRTRTGEEDLPLFRETQDEDSPEEPGAPRPRPSESAHPDPYAVTERVQLERLDEMVADLALRPEPRPTLDEDAVGDGSAEEGDVGRSPAADWPRGVEVAPALPPVERPAHPGERLQAAVVDLALLVALWSVVVYFAGRAAQVPVEELLPAWPYLGAYLATLGLVYAAYFTGTTGQTLGKIVTGLRVVDTAGRPPGYARAFLRAGVAALGILTVGAGLLPMLVDPARRALHDRLLRTRVVKF
ncbi:MAG: RDD family protein [Acidobacteria bacterium]|nr:RDD family protein [Acidobacteriota bacterium]